MIEHVCGAKIPATVGDFVEHIAVCPAGQPQLAAWARDVVQAVAVAAAMDETVRRAADVSAPVSRDRGKTGAVSREMTASDMAAMKRGGASLRDIAAVSGVAPETVRRKIRRLAEGSES